MASVQGPLRSLGPITPLSSVYRGVSWYILIDSGVLHRRYPIMAALREDQETVCIEKWPRRYLDNYIIWRILIRRKVLRDNGPFSTISGTCWFEKATRESRGGIERPRASQKSPILVDHMRLKRASSDCEVLNLPKLLMDL